MRKQSTYRPKRVSPPMLINRGMQNDDLEMRERMIAGAGTLMLNKPGQSAGGEMKMTFDDIVDLAEKAGCDVSAIDGREYQTMWCDSYQLERFAAALIQAGASSRDAEIAELVAALESVEWTWLGEMPEGNHCCYCGALKKHGHVTGCKVANVLKRTTLAQALAKLRKP